MNSSGVIEAHYHEPQRLAMSIGYSVRPGSFSQGASGVLRMSALAMTPFSSAMMMVSSHPPSSTGQSMAALVAWETV